MAPFCDWLKEWQTLVAGVLAFLAAAATVWVLVRQSRVEKLRYAELRKRRFQAVRAVLPADLSEICHYCTLCAQAIRAALQHFDQNRAPPSGVACPVLPERVISNLQRLVEHLDPQDAARSPIC